MNPGNLSEYQGAVITVMGLGRHKGGAGVGAVKWLLRHGAQVVITDLLTKKELRESVDEITSWYESYREQYPQREIYPPLFVLGEHREEDFTDVDLVLQNPGVQHDKRFAELAKAHGVNIETDESIFLRLYPHPVTVITGTRGKSTTCALLGEMHKIQHSDTVVAGNILLSPLEFLDELLEKPEPVPIVLEMTSWHIESLEDVPRAPDIAVLTNLSQDHISRYPTYADYVASKAMLFQRQGSEHAAVFNSDQQETKKIGQNAPAKRFWFSLSDTIEGDGAFVRDGNILVRMHGEERTLLKVVELRMQGEHNLANALAAVVAATLAGVSDADKVQALKSFGGLPGRQEVLEARDGVMFVNDAASASPDATLSALDRFSQGGPIILIAGGEGTYAETDALAASIAHACKAVILLPGRASDALAAAIADRVKTVRATSVADAVAQAKTLAVKDDRVILSPGLRAAAPYRNELERGDEFVKAL